VAIGVLADVAADDVVEPAADAVVVDEEVGVLAGVVAGDGVELAVDVVVDAIFLETSLEYELSLLEVSTAVTTK
jgi:hypothetical protein